MDAGPLVEGRDFQKDTPAYCVLRLIYCERPGLLNDQERQTQATKTHDYVRHGTLTLFAALNYLEGKLITRLAARHRHQEWLAFLKTIDDETLADRDIHIIADNYGTHADATATFSRAGSRSYSLWFS